jgi:hypothetical protein
MLNFRRLRASLPRRHFSVLPPAPAAPAAPPAHSPHVPPNAVRGLLPAQVAHLASRASSERSASGPIVFENPGAWVQTSRLTRAQLLALPPPRKALFPVTAAAETARYLRGALVGLLFVALAGYLALKDATGSPGARARLEATSPSVAAALVRAGLIEDVAAAAAPLDRRALARRVWARFTAGAARMPAGRAEKVIAAARAAALGEWTGAGGRGVAIPLPDAARAVIGGGAAQISADAFLNAFEAAVGDVKDIPLLLGVAHALDVRAAHAVTLARLGDLFDVVARVRGIPKARGAIDFSPGTLAALAADVGFAADEAHAARFLLGCAGAFSVRAGEASTPTASVDGAADAAARRTLAAVAEGAAESPRTGTATGAAARGAVSAAGASSVAVSRDEFVDYMVLAAAAVGAVAPERIDEYVRMFETLQPARAQAGVGNN